MNITKINNDSDAKIMAETNRVMGVVESYQELDRIVCELEPLGVDNVEVLEGSAGKTYLKKRENSFTGLVESVLGDLESETRRQYLRNLEQGFIVFAVPVTSENSQEVVATARICGAEHLASFGTLVNESFELPNTPVA